MSTSPNTLKFQYEKLDMIQARLAEAFPNELIRPTDTQANIFYKAGQASVVKFVNDLLDEN